MVKLGNVTPIIHHDKIISIGFKFKDYNITFKDSLQMLIISLRKLGKTFGVITQKSIFPYTFVNENNLNYIGTIPDFKYFDNITIDEYNKYKANFNNNWSLRDEAIKYCEDDVISLYQIVSKFNGMIFELFNINIHKYPTLSSLAFAIFRTHFLSNDTIPQLSGQIDKDIRLSYTGGAVDMYIPYNKKGVQLKGYDVNSLYPSRMRECDMPVGIPIYFEGDIRAIDPNAFGFFYCEIIAPDDLEHPILQTHIKTSGGLRTIAPIGTWKDMMFSEELDKALKYGYKINVLWGYKFERKIIFKDYVDFLYQFRLNYPSTDPLNYIAKILMNSLYGRFGMDDNFSEINIIHKDYLADFENKFFDVITNISELGDYFLVEVKTPDNILEVDSTTHNVNVGIASAITAYSRILMSQFKNNLKINLYYTDTDSIYTDSDLDESFISNKLLGKLKLEHVINKAIFLSPKVYYLETEENKVIYKVKGLKHEIELDKSDFESLLYKDAFIEKSQSKWFRNLSKAQINILEQIYTIKATENKRKLIFDNNSKLIGTRPFKLKDGILIK